MNYTENYHLPQWDEDDRILRTDFNGAMANLEDGLTDNRRTAEERSGALENLTYDRFCRMAYNQFQAAAIMEHIPGRWGMFYQDTGKSAEGLTGMVRFNDHYVVSNGQAFAVTEIRDMLKQITPLITGEGAPQAMRIEFTSPAAGMLTRIVFLGSGTDGLKCRLAYKDLVKGRIVWEEDVTFQGTVLDVHNWVNIHIGHKYEITLTPLQNNIKATVNLYEANTVYNGGCCVTGPEGSVVHTFSDPGENSGALVMVDCDHYGDSGDPVLLWNDEVVPVWKMREQPGGDEGVLRELIFRRDVPVEPGDTATLKLTCGEGGGEVHLYRWGAVLL